MDHVGPADAEQVDPLKAYLKNGEVVEGNWTGHGTDLVTGGEDVWLDDRNLAYHEIERFGR